MSDSNGDANKPAAAPAVPQEVLREARPDFVAPASGDAAAAVRSAIEAAGNARQVFVYVGASWCEPCQRFHDAVVAGELDVSLTGVRFVEFDADHDRARLEAANYSGELIPRFVLPTSDGRGSDRRIEGGVKGEGAVEHIMARLAPLVAPPL